MDSGFLIKEGFKKFGEFDYKDISVNKSDLNCQGVYAFVLDKRFPRLNGVTDILYIGEAGGRTGRSILKRMEDYLRAYKSAPQDKRISDSLKKVKTKIRVGLALRDLKLRNKVFIFYKKTPIDRCKKEENKLLKTYSRDHIELPPLNRQG